MNMNATKANASDVTSELVYVKSGNMLELAYKLCTEDGSGVIYTLKDINVKIDLSNK